MKKELDTTGPISIAPATEQVQGTDLAWSVGAVSDRLGVSASTLRTWERRYGVGPSHRTSGGHRRYTERDIDRVELMRRLVRRSISTQDAARIARHLDRDELAEALLQSEDDHLSNEIVVEALGAAVALGDTARVRELCDGVLMHVPFLDAWKGVLAPALRQVAHERALGVLEHDAEHAALDVIAEVVRDAQVDGPGADGQVLLASAQPDAEAVPFVALATGLSHARVGVHTIGPDLTWDEVFETAESVAPQVLVIWESGAAGALERRYSDDEASGALVRATPSWPHELSLRFGSQTRSVHADVGRAVRLVADRVA